MDNRYVICVAIETNNVNLKLTFPLSFADELYNWRDRNRFCRFTYNTQWNYTANYVYSVEYFIVTYCVLYNSTAIQPTDETSGWTYRWLSSRSSRRSVSRGYRCPDVSAARSLRPSSWYRTASTPLLPADTREVHQSRPVANTRSLLAATISNVCARHPDYVAEANSQCTFVKSG